METDFPSFHEDAQFSTSSPLSSDMMRDYQRILENIKIKDTDPWPNESIMNESAVGKEDFQQIMSDWQNHVGLLQVSEPEDVPLDLLSATDMMFDERSPILTKALTHIQKLDSSEQPTCELLGIKKEPIFEDDLYEQYLKNYTEPRFYNGVRKTEPTVVRKLTLLSGEKEILGKNIIGLHSLNEITENPDENCQVTSTVINGKRYRIIIKPKSQKVKKYTEEKIRKSLIKKLTKCNVVPKTEPKEDEIISEMRNGNYDVPLLGNDMLTSWDMTWFDTAWESNMDNYFGDNAIKTEPETPPKVPPLKIKLPKIKKHKKKKSDFKSDEEIDVETVGDKVVENEAAPMVKVDVVDEKTATSSENIKKGLPRKMVAQIESLKRKKDGRIPLVHVLPASKHVRNGTRMHDAAAAMTRNKLLKIVSGGDTVQLDHDYCSNTIKNFEALPKMNIKSGTEVNLTEKNPKKDSGMESGDVSDASEEPQTPETVSNIRSIQQINNKLLEQRKNGKTKNITKVAAAFFRAANVITSSSNGTNSDVVKTMVVSNGNKALTNDVPVSETSKTEGDKSDIVPSGSEICNSNDKSSEVVAEGESKANVSCSEQAQISQIERPKRKLKLEEYLSRRNGKGVENRKESFKFRENCDRGASNGVGAVEIKTLDENAFENLKEKRAEDDKETNKREKSSDSRRSTVLDKKLRRYHSRRSSSSSSGEREERREREKNSRSRSSWRGSRWNSWSKHKHRSSSRERRRSVWSRSLSRSSSRESSSSSDRSGGRRRRAASPIWSRRRSRSRSTSRERSRFRNRSYSNRRRQNCYFNRNFYSRRSRSPFFSYSVREKQRQIEERRVIYIGRIEEGMTNAKLRERFSVFGPIVNISLHFREYGDNYGFVTYAYKDDAYEAVEHGNDDPALPHYDLCFGGRRGFCKERYADLDEMPTSYSGFKDTPVLRSSEESFDLLLKKAQAKLKKRIKSEKL